MYKNTITFMGLALACLFACGIDSDPNFGQYPPGTLLTDASPAGPCTEADAMMSANFYVPGQWDLQGSWVADGDVPLSLIFDDGEILRTKQLTPTCDNGALCGGLDAATASGTYQIDNALLLLDWDNNPVPTAMSLPELFYTLKLCTDAVVINESHPTYGEVTYSRVVEGP